MSGKTLVLADMPLKQLLRLFKPEEPISVVALGDTWHPGGGYVDESLLTRVDQVGHLIAFDYDFPGLVYFEATIGNINVNYQQGHYLLSGSAKAIEIIVGQIRSLNFLHENPGFTVLSKG